MQKLATHWDGLRERLNQLRMPLARYRQQLMTVGAATHSNEIGVPLDLLRGSHPARP